MPFHMEPVCSRSGPNYYMMHVETALSNVEIVFSTKCRKASLFISIDNSFSKSHTEVEWCNRNLRMQRKEEEKEEGE